MNATVERVREFLFFQFNVLVRSVHSDMYKVPQSKFVLTSVGHSPVLGILTKSQLFVPRFAQDLITGEVIAFFQAKTQAQNLKINHFYIL